MTCRATKYVLSVAPVLAWAGAAHAYPGECGCMDVVLVVDDTGSMGAAIANVVAGLGNILDAAAAASKDTAGNDNLLIGLVTFADAIEVNQPLTADLAAVTAEISAIVVGGGNNEPEPSDAAVRYVVTGASTCTVLEPEGPLGAFRDECIKILVLVTDARPAGCDDSYDDGVDDLSAQAAAEAAEAEGILISAVLVNNGDLPSPAHPGGVEPYVMAVYASVTGGAFVTVPAGGSGTGDAIVDIVEDCGGAPPPPPVSDTARVIWRHHGTGHNVVWILDPDGVSDLVSLLPMPAPWKIAASADFDGDGFTDIAWRNQATGRNAIWAVGNVAVLDQNTLPTVSNLAWQIVGAGDIDGDGSPDLIWRHQPSGTNKAWLMNGLVIARREMLPPISPGYFLAGVGDFDADGRSDLLWRNPASGDNIAWLMDGLAVATSATLPVLNPNWNTAAIGDFDGDRRSDILWRRNRTGQNAIWRMDGPTRASAGALPDHSIASWKVIGAADVDADGKDDIVWRNISNGQNLVWFVDGFTMTGWMWLGHVPGQDWDAFVKLARLMLTCYAIREGLVEA